MSMPGSDLSQPASRTEPSSRSANITVSTESAITSRLTREARMPSWPMEMPSETEIVPNSSGKPPAARTPSFDRLASRSSDRLHGVISFHDDAMPICGLSQSSSVSPTARSIARAGARSIPSVTSRLRGLRSGMSLSLRTGDSPAGRVEGEALRAQPFHERHTDAGRRRQHPRALRQPVRVEGEREGGLDEHHRRRLVARVALRLDRAGVAGAGRRAGVDLDAEVTALPGALRR